MLRIAKLVLLSTTGMTFSLPAFAHPGHGVDNPLLHRLLHLVGGVDHAPAAIGLGVLVLTLAAALWRRSSLASRRRF